MPLKLTVPEQVPVPPYEPEREGRQSVEFHHAHAQNVHNGMFPECRSTLELGKAIVGVSGSPQWRFYCPTCFDGNGHYRTFGMMVAKKAVEEAGVDPHDLPIIRNSTAEQRNRRSACEACGEQPWAHEHHWAPTQLFGETIANMFGVKRLCPPCHTFWHSVVRDGATRRHWQSHKEQRNELEERWHRQRNEYAARTTIQPQRATA